MTEAQRECGACQLCCRLLPVKGIGKPGGVRCRNQKFGVGCKVYRKEGFPVECALWSCRWLLGEAGDTTRPDHAHYVVDIVPDYITANAPGQASHTVPVIQIWNDPHYPEAHRDPRLRAWLEAQSREGWCALVRFNEHDAIFLIPPIMSDTGHWEEVGGGERLKGLEDSHNAEDIAAKLNQAGITP